MVVMAGTVVILAVAVAVVARVRQAIRLGLVVMVLTALFA
jgi:hypothetical protein